MIKTQWSPKTLFRQFFPLLVVIALQTLLSLFVNLVDNLMLGKYSEDALSGAAIVNQIHFMLQMLVGGIGTGVMVLNSQYWGKRRQDPIRNIIAIGLKFSFAAGIIFFAVLSLIPGKVLLLFTDDRATLEQALEYVLIMRWTYLSYSISSLLMYAMQSVETAFIGTIMSGCTIIINAVLNYAFIFGNFGFAPMGITGAAIATLVSRLVELAIILVYILVFDKKLKIKLLDLLRFDRGYLRDFVKVALPVMITGSMWGIAQAVQTSILGHVSAMAIAANSIASVIYQIFSVFGMSCANASSVVIGKTVGEGKIELVRPYTYALQLVFLAFGIISGISLFVFKEQIVGFYDVSEETRRLAISFVTVLSVSAVGSCYEFPVMSGIIAGGGDTKFAAIIDNSFMWLFTIPLSAISAFVLKWPPEYTFICLKADQILKCIPNAIKCNRFRWIKVLTRPEEDGLPKLEQ